jgi:hypothetical protein
MISRVITLSSFVVFLCSVPSSSRGATTALVTLTAYDVSANVGSLDLVQHAASGCLTSVCSDAGARYAFGRVYIVNRYGCDNIQVLDPNANFATVIQFSVGNGSNPQDIALVNPRRAYVSRYGSPDLWIVNPQTGAQTGTVSLAAFADADGIPEMAQMVLLGGRLFVALQRLDRNNFFSPTDHSDVAVIDTATNALVDCDLATPGVQPIRLIGTNPVTDLVPASGGVLLVGEAGYYGVADGGVDVIDRAQLRALGFRSTEATLGGDLGDLDVADAATAYAIVSDADFNTHLVQFNTTTGAFVRPLSVSSGFAFASAALDGRGELLLADRSTGGAGGVRFFDVATGNELTAYRRTFCLPPNVVVPLDEPVTAVTARRDGAVRALSLRTVASPASRGGVLLRLELPHASWLRVSVLAANGRHVRTLASSTYAAGTHDVAWDGCDGGGTRTSRGAYYVVAEAEGERVSARVVTLGR